MCDIAVLLPWKEVKSPSANLCVLHLNTRFDTWKMSSSLEGWEGLLARQLDPPFKPKALGRIPVFLPKFPPNNQERGGVPASHLRITTRFLHLTCSVSSCFGNTATCVSALGPTHCQLASTTLADMVARQKQAQSAIAAGLHVSNSRALRSILLLPSMHLIPCYTQPCMQGETYAEDAEIGKDTWGSAKPMALLAVILATVTPARLFCCYHICSRSCVLV